MCSIEKRDAVFGNGVQVSENGRKHTYFSRYLSIFMLQYYKFHVPYDFLSIVFCSPDINPEVMEVPVLPTDGHKLDESEVVICNSSILHQGQQSESHSSE